MTVQLWTIVALLLIVIVQWFALAWLLDRVKKLEWAREEWRKLYREAVGKLSAQILDLKAKL